MLKCMILALSLCTTVLCTSAPIIFGQSAVISGPSQALGIEMRNGIQAAFKEINNYGGAQGRHLQLITLDDGEY
jgi:ABC-type branched-subunit amino acid transport system substrate-binding protein